MNAIAEIALILGICFVGEWISALLPVALPASVISMVLLMVLLLTGAVKGRHIQTVSRFLIVNMGLFFVPALVGTLQYGEILSSQLIPFLVVTFLTTPVVYLVTAWSVQGLMRLMKKKGGVRNA